MKNSNYLQTKALAPPPFSLSSFDSLTRNLLSINWNGTQTNAASTTKNARTDEPSKFTEYEVKVDGYWTQEDSTVSRSVAFKLLEEVSTDDESTFTLLKFLPADTTVDMSAISYLALGNFTGTVYKYTESGELTSVEGYDQGELEKTLTFAKSDKKSSNRSAKLDPNLCEDGDCEGAGDGTYVWVDIDTFVDYYVSGNGGPPRYQYSEQTGHRREPVYVPSSAPTPASPQHEHRPHGGSGGSSGSSSPHPEEIIKHSSFKGTEIECAFNKLTKTGIMKTYLKRFEGSFSVANLILRTNNLDDNVRATTIPPVGSGSSPDYAITIVFNVDNSVSGYKQRPTLLNAKTIMHEMIHAELYRKLMSVAQKGTLNSERWTRQQQIDYVEGIRENFPGIYDYYRRYVKNWQHAQMATHYRETIAGALQEFDNNKYSWQYYMNLAWEGLRDEKIPSWSSLSPTEQLRATTTISSYRALGSKSCP